MPERGLYLIKWLSVIEVNLQSEALGADDQCPSEVYFRGACIGLALSVLWGAVRSAEDSSWSISSRQFSSGISIMWLKAYRVGQDKSPPKRVPDLDSNGVRLTLRAGGSVHPQNCTAEANTSDITLTTSLASLCNSRFLWTGWSCSWDCHWTWVSISDGI